MAGPITLKSFLQGHNVVRPGETHTYKTPTATASQPHKPCRGFRDPHTGKCYRWPGPYGGFGVVFPTPPPPDEEMMNMTQTGETPPSEPTTTTSMSTVSAIGAPVSGGEGGAAPSGGSAGAGVGGAGAGAGGASNEEVGVCYQCGTPLDSWDNYCPNCGAQADSDEECEECGYEDEEEAATDEVLRAADRFFDLVHQYDGDEARAWKEISQNDRDTLRDADPTGFEYEDEEDSYNDWDDEDWDDQEDEWEDDDEGCDCPCCSGSDEDEHETGSGIKFYRLNQGEEEQEVGEKPEEAPVEKGEPDKAPDEENNNEPEVVDQENQPEDEMKEPGEEEPEDPDRQGMLRKVDGAHLVFKRKNDEGLFDELWIYNIGPNIRDELDIKKDILAATDIPQNRTYSDDGKQTYQVWTAGNAQLLRVTGLPN